MKKDLASNLLAKYSEILKKTIHYSKCKQFMIPIE